MRPRFVAYDLANVNRTRTPWIVVGMHRMMVRFPHTSHLGNFTVLSLQPGLFLLSIMPCAVLRLQ